MLKITNELLNKKGWRIAGLAPTSSSAKELEKSLGIQTNTLQGFLKKYDGYAAGRGTVQGLEKVKTEYKNTMLLIDEASLSSSDQMLKLLKISGKLNTRLVLVGDKKQIDSVEAGRPFYQLQEAGMKTAKMTEIVRQEKTDLKDAVYATIREDINKAFEKLSGNIYSASTNEQAKSVENIATDLYFSAIKDSSSVMVLSTSNTMREKVNNLIRVGLGEKGYLTGAKDTLNSFVSKHLTSTQMQYASEFRKGDILCFNKALSAQNIKKWT